MKPLFWIMIALFQFLTPVSLVLPGHPQEDAWTWINPLPQGNHLYDVWGAKPNNVYAVGNRGALLHYDGSQWRRIFEQESATFYDVWGPRPTVCMWSRTGTPYTTSTAPDGLRPTASARAPR